MRAPGDALVGFVRGQEPGAAARDGETLWGAPLPEGSAGHPHQPARAGRCGGPRGSPLLPARSNLKAWLCLAAAPALAAPQARHKCPSEEKCRERKKYLERQEKGESRRCGREPRRGLKARSQRAFVRPGRAQRCCQHGGAVPAPAAPGVVRPGEAGTPAACPVPRPGDTPVSRMRPLQSLRWGAPSPRLGWAPRCRPRGGQRSGINNALAKIIASDRSISSARFRLNFIMVSVTMATCKNNISPSPANSP